MDKIICVGKNYADHARELGDAPPEKPILFLKPPSAIYQAGTPLNLPPGEVHFELEIVFQLTLKGKTPFSSFTLGLDFTRRDLQKSLKKIGHPWEIAKVFSNAIVLGPWRPMNEWPTAQALRFELFQNGVRRQSGFAADMIFSAEDCLASAKSHFPICEGDLLFTGTPSGVGPVHANDRLEFQWGTWKFSLPPIQVEGN